MSEESEFEIPDSVVDAAGFMRLPEDHEDHVRTVDEFTLDPEKYDREKFESCDAFMVEYGVLVKVNHEIEGMDGRYRIVFPEPVTCMLCGEKISVKGKVYEIGEKNSTGCCENCAQLRQIDQGL